MPDKPELSVVVPVYNSAGIFPELHKRLKATLSRVVKSYEIIAVVDGCKDNSADIIAGISKEDDHVKLIELSRNFGEQAATTAGLRFATGKMVVVMDDDLEDPPEIITQFIEKANEGFDVVYGIMTKRKTSRHRRFFYRQYYRFLNIITDIHMPSDAGSYSLMKRNVVDELNAMPESNRYVRGMRTWVGFNQVGIEYERGTRYSGDSGYSLIKYFKFALDAILSFSYKPLSYLAVSGVLIFIASVILGGRLIILKLTGNMADVPGWVSLMIIVLFLGGIQIFGLGLVGQYMARIYDEAKQRPSYIIKRKVGLDS